MTESQNILLSIENSEMSVNDKIINFSKYLLDNSLQVFGKTFTSQNSKCGDAKKKSSWFNENCKNAQKDFARARNTFLKYKTDANRREFAKNRTKYNRLKSKAKKLHKIKEGNKLNEFAKNQPKQFGKTN